MMQRIAPDSQRAMFIGLGAGFEGVPRFAESEDMRHPSMLDQQVPERFGG